MKLTAPIFLDLQKPLCALAPVASGERESGHLCVTFLHYLFISLFIYSLTQVSVFQFPLQKYVNMLICISTANSRLI